MVWGSMVKGRHRSRVFTWIVALVVVLLGIGAGWRWWNRADERVSAADVTKGTSSSRHSRTVNPHRRTSLEPQPLSLLAATATPDVDENGVLTGRVVSATNRKAIASAELVFVRGDGTYSVSSGSDGQFRFTAPSSGVYELTAVTAKGYLPFAPRFGHSPIRFAARAHRAVRDVTISLEPAVDYVATVLDGKGEPVATARVEVITDLPGDLVEPFRVAPTNEKGETIIHAPDWAIIAATKPGYGTDRQRLDFAAQVSHRLTFHLKASPATKDGQQEHIAGTVVDPEGAAVSGALVRATPSGPSTNLLAREVSSLSDPSGRFDMSPLDTGTYTLIAEAAPWAPAVREGIQAGVLNVTLTLANGAVLSGNVHRKHDGSPIAAFAVVVRGRQGSRPLSRSFLDASGHFEMAGLTPGPERIMVAAQGCTPAQMDIVVTNEGPNEIDVELEAGSRIAGRVTDAVTKKPIADAQVSAEGGVGDADTVVPIVAHTSTDSAGNFELVGLAEGVQSIVASAARHHGKIVSGLNVEDGRDLDSVEIALTPLAPGEKPSLELTGIGAVLSMAESKLRVDNEVDGGGAITSGLEVGDAIVEIDGQAVSELTFPQAINLIRGPEGTTVTLVVQKKDGTTVEIEVPRRSIRG